MSELTRVDDERVNKSYTYSYDNGGNLTSVSEYAYTTGQLGNATATHTYSYDTVWKDKLLSYDGQAIAYDTMGNPTSYMGAAMTWSNGRELSSIVDGNDTISYTYTTDGIRLSKTVNNIETRHILDGSTILSETTGNETLNYYYDSTGDLQQIGYKKGTAAEVYYLVAHNGQGDVIAIYNASDSTPVGTYTYDAWGKILSADTASSTSDPNDILMKNPFRYRGYYYDRETGFYYLQSRYYNPGLGRFINADAYIGQIGDLLGHNWFAYCENNPIIYSDPTGYFLGTITGALVGGIIGGVTAVVQKKDFWTGVTSGAVSGAIVGAAADIIVATGGTGAVAIGAMAFAGAAGAAAGNVIDQIGNKWKWGKGAKLSVAVQNLDTKSIVKSAVIGALAGALTGVTGQLLVVAQKTSADLYTFAVLSGASKETITATGRALINSATNAYFYDTASGAIYTITANGIDYLTSTK